MKKSLYYTLSFTWGLPLTLVGLIAAYVLIALGYKPKKWLYGYYFEIGKGWGGVNLGIIFLCGKGSSIKTKNHEFGHSLQNCVFGIFTIFIVCIPSVIRYWHRTIREQKGLKNKTTYDSVWFEGQATEWGNNFYKTNINNLKGE